MTTDTTTALAATIDTYLAAWNEPDAAKRAPLVEQSWAPEGTIVDPPIEGVGHAGIIELMSALHTHYAGHRFRRASGIDSHHNVFRFGWEMVAPDGAVAVAGIDVGEVAEDGRLRRITGFFGPLPEAV